MKRSLYRIILLVMVLSLSLSLPVVGGRAPAVQAATGDITFGIVHTNDFHGALEPNTASGYPGAAREATTIKSLQTKWGANMLLLNAGDSMQGSLLSNIKKGVPTIAYFKSLGFDASTFGNHEFDWGQDVLGARIDQAADASLNPFPYVTANIVKKAADGTCNGWDAPTFGTSTTPVNPFTVLTVGTVPDTVKVGVIGVTTQEVPNITIASATEGLCFKDPEASILHYYDTLKSQSDIVVVLSHLGLEDGGYGYGIPVYGDKTLADKLIKDGKPVDIIIGGHSHTNMAAMATVGTAPGPVTYIAQARSSSRNVGEFTVTYNTVSKAVSVTWLRYVVNMTDNQDQATLDLIDSFKDQAYLDLIGTEIGWSQVNVTQNYNADNLGGDFIDDSIYNFLNTDKDSGGNPITTNDVDMFFNNAGGLRADIKCTVTAENDCTSTGSLLNKPFMITYGDMFNVLPFGNATVVGTMTGAEILQVLNQSATLSKGAIQPAGIKYKFYRYLDGTYTYAWGAYDACVINKTTQACDPLDLNKTYKVGTNEFLAPAGGDSYAGFKYMKNVSYWGDMLVAVNAYVNATYTATNPYKGPMGDGTLDGRITRNGTDTYTAGPDAIIPVTILHHNDSHGNLVKGQYVGYTQLATLIKQERAHNPTRTLLLNGGDDIQGDAMSYYFKSAPLGVAADGTDLVNPALNLPKDPLTNNVYNPMMAVLNSMNYDALVLGNHEFNFGSAIFKAVLGQANFPVLGANVTDDGAYGLADASHGAGVKPYVEKTLDGIKVAIVGITNHRIPNYELPSNIPGLTFSNPIATAKTEVDAVKGTNDVVIALTHIGFTTNPKSLEVDENVDTNLAAQVDGLTAIIGAHSHTNPANPEAPYKFLPTIVTDPSGKPVIINQAYRYNNTLGEVILGMRAKAGGGYEVVTQAGTYLSVALTTPEDAATKAIVDPYSAVLASYNDKVVGQTTAPIDTEAAFVAETNGANLQADAALYELAKNGITDVDFHLSGAMTNKLVASTATPATPVTLKISDMFAAMPYENSLVVLRMNGPQLKAVLERAYRNYYYYKYVPGYGGYSHYTTCMIDTNAGSQITYAETTPRLPNNNNVVSLTFTKDGAQQVVDFKDATKFYNVSTVNYLAAGSCNFNDGGKSLWPLDQTLHDTQYYVRDAVIDYITFKGTVSPAIEGRLQFSLANLVLYFPWLGR